MVIATRSMPVRFRSGHTGLAALLACALHGWAGPAAAVDALVIEAREIHSPDLHARDVVVRIDIARDRRVTANARIGSLDVGGGLDPLRGIAVACARPALDEPRFGCDAADLRIAATPLGALQLPMRFGLDSRSGELTAGATRVAFAGGQLTFAARSGEADWSLRAQLDGGTLAALRPWIERLATLPEGLLLDGKVSAQAQLRGRTAIDAGRVELTAAGIDFSNDEGTIVGEKAGFTLVADLAAARQDLSIRVRLASAGGQALAGPVLLDLNANPLQAEAQALWQAPRLSITRLDVAQQALLKAHGNAQLDLAEALRIRSAVLEIERVEMPAAYTSFLQIALAATDFGTLDTTGTLSGHVEMADDALTRIDARLDGLDLVDTGGKFTMRQLRGALHWAPQSASAPPASRLEWSQAGAYGLSGGAARLDFTTQGRGFALSAPARLPVFDGALAIRAFSVAQAGTPEVAFTFEGDIEPISMPRIARAFGWPEFAGRLSGRIPRVEYRDRLLTFGGDLEAQVFDGVITGSHIRLQDPLGSWPRLFADVKLRNLDLGLVTDTFSIGSITGRLEGELRGLELFNWSPVAFDAYLQTPPGYRGPRRISAKAVGTLSNVGGGGGGVVQALQSGVFRMFDEYDYDRLGIRCRLGNDVCLMSGVEPAGAGYYILKGRGVPRINIIGNSGRVNWPQLMSQVTAQMTGEGTVRVE